MHEQSITEQIEGRWYNLHGKTREPLAPQYPYERPSYDTMQEAVSAAKRRSEDYGRSIAAGVSTPPVTAAPASEATPGQPPFVKWLSDARQVHPDVPASNLAQRYLRQYGKADPSTLPSWQEFFPQARVNNPGVHKADLKGYWSSVYGAVGASEKAPEKAPRFMEGVVRGAKAGAAALGESVAGAVEFLLPRAHPFQEIAKGAGDAMRAEAEKLAPAPELAEQPWYQRLTNPHYLGQLLGDMAVETAPSLGAFGAGAIAGSAGGPVGALVGGTAAMAGTIFLQQAGSVFREASDRYQQAGLPRAEAEQRAFRDAGLAGFVSGAVNSVGVPASLVAPFRRTLVNLVVQYGLNVGVDTADQITQNILAQHAYAPERELTEGVPEAAAGSALLSSPQTLVAAKVARRLGATTAVPSTTVPQTAAAPVTPREPATDPLAGILRQPTVEGAIDQAERSLQAPLVTTDALDRAIAGAARLDTLHSGAPTAARPPVAPQLDAAIRQELVRVPVPEETPPARSTIEAATARRVQAERQQAPTAELTPSETELAQVWRTYQEAQTPEARAAILERAAPATRSYMQEVAARGGALEAPRAGAAEMAPIQAPPAPQLRFNGVQYGLPNEPGIELWTLHSPYPGLTEGSTYSRQTLEQAGVAVPVAPVEPARGRVETSRPVHEETPKEPEQPAFFDARSPRYVVQPIPPQGVFGERYQVMDRVDGRPMSRVPSSSRETADEIADHLNAGGELMEPTAPYAATAATVHSLPITEAMRRSVLTEGQALFERRSPYGRTLRPEADPVRSRQLTLDALGDLDRAVDGVSTLRGAVAPEGSGVRTVGLGIRRDLIRTGRLDLRGLVARSPEDIATIGQVFRDPRFETLRYLYMKGDQIVGHEAVTSRLPGLTYAFLKRPGQPVNIARALYEMRDRMRRLGADGYYIMHNHPSGSPVPSPEDVSLTRRFAQDVPGFRGHIVINSGTYGLIEATGARIAKPQVRILPTAPSIDVLLQAGQPHQTINHPLTSPDDVARLGKQLQSSDRYVAILYRSASGKVRAAQEMPVGLFTRPAEATDYLRGRAREFGAPQAFAYYQGEDPSIQHAARALIQRGALRDFVSGGGHSTITAPDLVASEGQTFGRSIDALGSTRVAETKAPDVVPPTAAPEPVEADVTFAPVGVLDHAIRTWLDQFVDVRRVVEGLKAAGRTLADEFNPVYREEVFLGRVAHETKSFLSDELLPLTQAMRLAKVSQADLNQYLHARHASEANAVLQARNPDLPNNASLSGMTNAEAAHILQDAPPSMEPLAKRVDAIVGRTRALMVSYGLESPQTIHAWSTRYRYYVPLQRAGFEEEASRGTGRGRDIRGPSSQARVGSAREVTNILANIALQRERTIVRGEKMRPVTALAALLMRYPQPEIAQLSKPVPISYTDPQTGLTETAPGDVGDYRVPTIRTLNKRTGVVEVRPDPAYQGRDNVVNFRVGGQDYAIVFNEQNERARNMARALKGMDIPSLNGLLQTVAPVTRFFASINTQYSPFFGIRNFLRDAGFASLSLSSTPLAGQRATVAKYALESLRGIYAEARAVREGQHAEGVAAKWWRRFDAAGGPTGYRDLYQSSTDRAQAIEQMLDPDWWMKTVGGKALTAAGTLPGPAKLAVDRAARPLFQWLSDYNLMMENSIRLGVFRTAVEHGLSDIRAASLAKNITVNFNRKGTVTAQVGALYAFFNASAQGSARVADTLFQAGKPGQLSRAGKAIVAGGIVLGVMQAAMLELAGFGDEEPPEWQRETNFVVPLPGTDRKYVSVPYPLGFNVLPNIGRLGTEAALHGHVTKHIYNFLGLAMDAFSPFGAAPTLSQVLSPTATDPLIALEENKDWRGRPIAREDHDALRPTPGHTRAKPGASAWGLAMARGINWATGGNAYRRGILSPTPDQIDYLIAQFTGGIGRELGRASRLVTGAVRGEDMPLSTVPLLGQYVGSGASSQAIRDRFYQHIKELNQLEAEWKGRRADREPVTSFLHEHPEVRLAPYGRLTERTVSMLQKRKQAAISHDAPSAEVRRLDDLITTHMRRLNDRVQQATAQ